MASPFTRNQSTQVQSPVLCVRAKEWFILAASDAIAVFRWSDRNGHQTRSRGALKGSRADRSY